MPPLKAGPGSFKRLLGGIFPRHELNVPTRELAREFTIDPVAA
jgi:hypothetical protein